MSQSQSNPTSKYGHPESVPRNPTLTATVTVTAVDSEEAISIAEQRFMEQLPNAVQFHTDVFEVTEQETGEYCVTLVYSTPAIAGVRAEIYQWRDSFSSDWTIDIWAGESFISKVLTWGAGGAGLAT